MSSTTASSARGTAATALRPARRLIAAYAGVSMLAVAVLAVMHDHDSVVTTPAWVRACIVAATSLLMLGFAARAARGSASALRRLRIVSAIMLVAIVVIVVLPGAFPVWLRVEQAVCGVLLAGVVVLVNSTRVRSVVGH